MNTLIPAGFAILNARPHLHDDDNYDFAVKLNESETQLFFGLEHFPRKSSKNKYVCCSL